MPAAVAPRLVALAMPPGEEFIAALEAAWARGDAVLPLDPRAPRPATDALVQAMAPDEPVDPGVALVIATSGSTGEPKGVQLTRAALQAAAYATHRRIGRQPDDVWLSCLPWHHIGGLQVMLRARLLGIPLVVQPRFDVEAVATTAATLVSLVPTQLARLLDAGVGLSRFRVVLLGGAAAPAPLLARARAVGVPVVTTYGMSETAGGCVYDGRPLDGVAVRIAGDGRIAIRGPMLMSGYRGRPDLDARTLVDGWLLTRDLGVLDDDGTLRVLGRLDDVIVSGGENVAAALVEAAVRAHPGVGDVSVVGVPDAVWGECVVAVVSPGPGGMTGLAGPVLRGWCAHRLPPAAVPRHVVVVPALPLLSSGKPDRRAVAALAQAALATSQSAVPGSQT